MQSKWELLEDGSFNGVAKYIRSVGEDEVEIKHEFHNVSNFIDRNKDMQNDDFDRRSDFWHAASIPVTVIYEWIHKYGVNAYNPDHVDGVKKLLNSSDYRYLKVKNIII